MQDAAFLLLSAAFFALTARLFIRGRA